MKRNMDIVRQILIKAEGMTEEQGRETFTLDGVDPVITNGHVEIMKEGGLLHAQIGRSDGTGIYSVRVFRLTWDGHDFLAAIRNDTIWNKTKKQFADHAIDWTFDLLKAVAVGYGKQLLLPGS